MRRTEHPDAIIDHLPESCPGCGEALSATDSIGHQVRQVFDLPDPQPLAVTEHRAHECHCRHRGATARAEFPEAVAGPVQYGPNIAAVVAYLSAVRLLPEDRIAQLLYDLHRIEVSAASIAAMISRKAADLASFAEAVGQAVGTAPVKHADETGMRVGAALRWLQVAATTLLTFYIVTCKRGEIITDMIGVLVHDHFKSYFSLDGVLHSLCNAHHLRELKALIDIEKEQWAKDYGPAAAAGPPRRQSGARQPRAAVLRGQLRGRIPDASSPMGSPSTRRGRPWIRPARKNLAAQSGAQATIFSSACAIMRTPSCASRAIRQSPSPIMSPSGLGAWQRSR